MPILVDTGILYALADEDDAWHDRARAWLEELTELLIAPVTVLPEVAYLLHTQLGTDAELTFVQSVAAGELEVEALGRQDFERSCEVMRKYPALGFVDASIVAVAERLKLRTIATTDRRHFGTVVPKQGPPFQLVP
jgi:predicted nucleic acid-binding protein